MQQSATAIRDKQLKERTRRIVSAAMQRTRTESAFRRELSAQGIDLVLRRNEDHRIYGVTFIDHHSRVVLNGSRLGKDFSANVFNEYFSSGEEPQPQQEQPTVTGNHTGQRPSADTRTGTTAATSADGGLLSLFSPDPVLPDREPPLPRKRRKKRRRYGRQD